MLGARDDLIGPAVHGNLVLDFPFQSSANTLVFGMMAGILIHVSGAHIFLGGCLRRHSDCMKLLLGYRQWQCEGISGFLFGD